MPPPTTAALTSLHGEEEEEEGSGSAAPAAGSWGPGARQPRHRFASAGDRDARRALYVGHEPPQPAPSHRLVETGTRRYQGNGFQPRSIPPRPPAPHPGASCSSEPRAQRGIAAARCRRTVPAPCAASTLFCAAGTRWDFCIQGTVCAASRLPQLMGIHGGGSPRPPITMASGCRQELPALFPAFAAKTLCALHGCLLLALTGPSPTPTAHEGLCNGAGQQERDEDGGGIK